MREGITKGDIKINTACNILFPKKNSVRKAIPKTTQSFIMNRANHKCEICGCDIDFIKMKRTLVTLVMR